MRDIFLKHSKHTFENPSSFENPASRLENSSKWIYLEFAKLLSQIDRRFWWDVDEDFCQDVDEAYWQKFVRGGRTKL